MILLRQASLGSDVERTSSRQTVAYSRLLGATQEEASSNSQPRRFVDKCALTGAFARRGTASRRREDAWVRVSRGPVEGIDNSHHSGGHRFKAMQQRGTNLCHRGPAKDRQAVARHAAESEVQANLRRGLGLKHMEQAEKQRTENTV